MDNFMLDSRNVVISEDSSDSIFVKFVICDFDVNGNGVQLDRSTISNWLPTLINKPLLGKIEVSDDGDMDFTGHNPYVVHRSDENGDDYQMLAFDTSAFGTFISAGIEEIDGVDYITATAQVWKRFFEAAELIAKRVSEGTLHSSWEVCVSDYSTEIKYGASVKVIKDGTFIGHTLLGADVPPAYSCTTVLSLSSEDADKELASAILKGMFEMNEENKVIAAQVEDPVQEPETVVETSEEPVAEPVAEVSALTTGDLYERLTAAVRHATGRWAYICYIMPEEHVVVAKTEENALELEYTKFVYEVNGDEVSVGEGEVFTFNVPLSQVNTRIAELNEAIIDANKKISEQEATIAELMPYKAEHDRAEAERKQAEHEAAVSELRAYVAESGQFTDEELDGEELGELISNLEKDKLNNMIVERLISSKRSEPVVDTGKEEYREPTVTSARVILQTVEVPDFVQEVRKFLYK